MVLDKSSRLDGLPAPIPLKVLFGNHDKRTPRISPDGQYYAYIADDADGVANVFVKPVHFDTSGETPELVDAAPQQVTHEQQRPLRYFVWAKSIARRRILYAQDSDGDENFHLYVAEFELDEKHEAQNVSVRDVTPFGAVTVLMPEAVKLNAKHPDTAIISLNKRDARVFDAYKLDLNTGEIEMLVENPGDVTDWVVDDDLNIVGSQSMDPSDGSEALRVPASPETKAKPSEWKTIAHWPHGEICQVLSATKDGKGVYVQTSLVHKGDSKETTNTSRLVVLSLENGQETQAIAQHDKCDVGSISFNETNRTVQYVVFNYLKPVVEVIDETLRSDIERLVGLCAGAFELVSASHDNQTWMYSDMPDNGSLKYYIYDRETQQRALLFDSRPALAQYTLTKMEPRVIQTSDGEDMVIYVSLPHGVAPEKLPFVLCPHGGPWHRDVWGFNITHQHLTNCGYGVLSVNFRGSTGYGKRWWNLGDREWGGKMQQDLTDAVEWAIKEGLADPERVAISGGSYGGYATLAGLAFTPDLYACGIDVVGVAHLKTFFASIPPYWVPMKRLFELRIGDIENDDELNRKISPVFHADMIKKPLLIAQGANDPRVKQDESDQIAKQLYDSKRDVEYVLYMDEGHAFVRPANRIDLVWRKERFLATHLGGRVMPRDDELVAGNSAVEIDLATL